MSIERFFEDGITYKVPTITRDAAGGNIETLGAAVALRGRIRPMTGNEVLAAEKLNTISSHVVYCLPEANLTVTCHVYYGGDHYLVKYIKNPMNYSRHWEVLLELVK